MLNNCALTYKIIQNMKLKSSLKTYQIMAMKETCRAQVNSKEENKETTHCILKAVEQK